MQRTPLIAAVLRFASGLRFRSLFYITALLFLFDLMVPDLIPFFDELLLGLLMLVFGDRKKCKDEGGKGKPRSPRIEAVIGDNRPEAN